MNGRVETLRLYLVPLKGAHSSFIRKLLNSEGWLKYIGNRNIGTLEDAEKYIQKISNNLNCNYWVCKLKLSEETIGIVTLIKRNYLDTLDIGFAMLPEHEGKGYAFEASHALLKQLTAHKTEKKIAAITIPENIKSIKLLEKLGLRFEKEITQGNEVLVVYSMVLS